ncbi:MAG: hypothetical protein KC777_23325 [Cyanobacteria bacterium HKST-UBA02]|nr:hypothetical protein [Cyanobacteria bacterium HKST-UBA02]
MVTESAAPEDLSIEKENEGDSPSRQFSVLTLVFLIICTAAPVLNIAWITATVGTDNVSNDYMSYAHLIDSILNGTYNLASLVPDTFYRGHATTLPFLTHLASARWFHGSVMPELYLGLLLGALRLALWFDACRACAASNEENGHRQPLFLLPIIALLVFSCSQISLYTYSGATLPIGLSLFGQALAVWGLARLGTGNAGVAVAAAGGLLSAYSWGNGPITWVAIMVYYLAAAFGSKRFHPGRFAALLACGATAAIPYVMSLFTASGSTGAIDPAKTLLSFFNTRVIVELLGWAFARDIATHTDHLRAASFAGIGGLISGGLGLVIVFARYRRAAFSRLAIPLILIFSGLLTVYQVSLVRALLAPWYATLAISFWVGLAALAAYLISDRTPAGKPILIASRLWSAAFLIFLGGIYFSSNTTFEDKTYMLNARAPVSVSALARARSAPTYADQYVFLWTPGAPSLLQKLSGMLERHSLIPFGPEGTTWLQGDFLFDAVRISGAGDAPIPYFTDDARGARKPVPFWDYHQLDLVLPPQNKISWTVTVPEDATACVFKTDNLATGQKAFKLLVNGEKKNLDPQIDLVSFKGRQVTIDLDYEGGTRGEAPVILSKPRLIVRTSGSSIARPGKEKEWLPENTEFGRSGPTPTLVSTLSLDTGWSTDRGTIMQSEGSLRLQGPAEYSCAIHDAPPAGELGCLLMELRAPSSMNNRLVVVKLETEDGSRPDREFNLPFLGSEDFHVYSYDLKLLELERPVKIRSITLKTLDPGADITIRKLGFTGK